MGVGGGGWRWVHCLIMPLIFFLYIEVINGVKKKNYSP